MSEESKSRSPWDVLAGLIPHDLREIVGFLLLFFIFFGGMMALGKLPKYFDSLADSPIKQYCWSLKDVRGVLIKFNQCTGETAEVNINNPPVQSHQSASCISSAQNGPPRVAK